MKLILSSLRILRAVIIVLLLAITLLLYIILETPVGLQLACKLAPAFVPFTLQIDNPQGALLDNISVDKFIYRDKYVDVEVTHARIHLEPWLLFSKEVRLDYAHAADVSVIVFNNDTPSTMTREKLLNDLTLPIGIHLMNASTQHLLVGEQDRTPWVDAYGVNGSNILMNGVPRIAVDAQWQRGTLGFIPNVNLHTAQGALWIDSHLPDYNFKFAAHLKYNDDATDRLVHLVGQGDFSSVTLSKMSLHEENNHFSAPMKITWLPYFILEIPSIQGQWHHYPIQGHISLRNEDQHWVIDNSELTVHDASVTVNGQYQQQGQFNFKIAIPHIETLIEHSHGHLFSTGTWQGDTTAPHLEASVDAGDIKVGDDLLLQKLQGKVTANSTYPIQNQSYWTQFSINANATADKIQLADNHLEHADLQLNGAIDGQHAGSLLAQLTHLQINGELIKSVKLSAQNKNFSQQISIASSIGDKTISSTLSGHYQNNIWQGFLETLQTNFNVHLQKRTPLTLSKNTVQINSLCFALKTSSLCGNLNWQKDQPSTASVTGKNIPLDIISKFFLPESNTTGTLSIDAQMTLLNQKLQTGKMNLALSNGKFTDHAGFLMSCEQAVVGKDARFVGHKFKGGGRSLA